MYQPYERARFDSPELDLERFADRISSGKITVKRDDANEQALNAIVHADNARKILRSSLSSDRKQSARARARTALRRALEALGDTDD